MAGPCSSGAAVCCKMQAVGGKGVRNLIAPARDVVTVPGQGRAGHHMLHDRVRPGTVESFNFSPAMVSMK